MRRLNRYVEETRPWELAKDEADPERLDEVLYNLAEGLRVTTLMLVPFLPRTAEKLLAALGEESVALAELGSRPGGQSVERIRRCSRRSRRDRERRAPRGRAGRGRCAR